MCERRQGPSHTALQHGVWSGIGPQSARVTNHTRHTEAARGPLRSVVPRRSARCWSTLATLMDVSTGHVATGRGRLCGPIQLHPTWGAAVDSHYVKPSAHGRQERSSEAAATRASVSPTGREPLLVTATDSAPNRRLLPAAQPLTEADHAVRGALQTGRTAVGQRGQPTGAGPRGDTMQSSQVSQTQSRAQVERRDASGFMLRPAG